MTILLSISCFLICFAAPFIIFCRLVVKDPLRVILFILGSFFWLVSLLFTSIAWKIMMGYLLPSIFVSVIFQEIARGLYYILLHKAQGPLAKLAISEVEMSGLQLIQSSRHILAVVCGLGMGVMAALFLLLNILADYSDDGVVGLKNIIGINATSDIEYGVESAFFPIYYSMSCSFLIMQHICWTILLWDGLHKRCLNTNLPEHQRWYIPVATAVVGHLVNNGLSLGLRAYPIIFIVLQALLLVINFVCCAHYVNVTSQ